MSTARKSGAERREEIVEMTLRLLRDTGADSLSAQMIADHVGITQGGLFRHFPTKKDLWFGVLSEIERRAFNAWDSATQENDPALSRLRNFLLSQLALIEAYPGIPALLFSTGRLAAVDVVHPIHMRIMTGLRLRLLQELATAVHNNELSGDVSPLDAESLLMGLVQDCVLRWSLTGRGYNLVAEGDRLIRLQLRLLGSNDRGGRT